MGIPHSRRSVLAGAGALVLAAALPGCTAGSPPPPTPSTTPAPPDPLLTLLAARVDLVAACGAVVAAHPDLSGRVQPIAEQIAEQVTALRLALALPTTSASSPSSASGTVTTSSGPVVPADRGAARAGLRASVQAAGDTAGALCRTTSAERAPLVGSLAAAAAGHALVLV